VATHRANSFQWPFSQSDASYECKKRAYAYSLFNSGAKLQQKPELCMTELRWMLQLVKVFFRNRNIHIPPAYDLPAVHFYFQDKAEPLERTGGN
jgi:hypothetical protein